jgi:hypothetical protein
MRKSLFAALFLLFAASVSHAQSTIAVSASHIQSLNGGLMTSGSLCFQATNENNINIGVQVSGGGVVIFTPFCTSVSNGAIVTFNVPNPANSSPTNVRYRITITQGSRTVATFPGSYLCLASGACTTPYTFNFDTCISTGACIAVPIPVVAGPGGPPGATGPTGPAGPINQVYNNGSPLTVEPYVNLISGSNVTASCVDNGGATRTDCTISSTSSGLFGALVGGTNNSAAMVLGTGASLTFSGSGTNNASSLQGNTWAIPQALGSGTPAAVTGSSMTDTAISGTQCVHAILGVLTGTGSDCITGSAINIWTANQIFKGQDPWADVKAFGAKNVGTTVYPVTTATCGSTATTCTLGSAQFSTGDGIAIVGAGAANTMSTPSAPTVLPSMPATGGAPDAPSQSSVTGITGSSTYLYKVIASDQNGGLTVPSSATTYTTALASLGLNTLTVSTLSRSNQTVTVTTTGTQTLAVGAMVHLYGMSDAQFEGYFNVATVNNAGNSFTITNTPMDTRYGATTSATGGHVGYYNANKITWTAVTGAWKYYICASRPADSGAYHLIGQSMPTGQTGGKYTITSFFDYGSTINGNQTYPPYVSDSTCTSVSATNDILSTTVTAGGGTTTITLNDATTAAVTSARIVYDAVPAIKAAIQSIGYTSPAFTGGTIYLPPSPNVGQTYGYPINSYFKVPSNINIMQSGHVIINETLELPSGVTWDGGMGSDQAPQFAVSQGALIVCIFADPCVYGNTANNGLYQNLIFEQVGPGVNTNGGNVWMTDDSYTNSWRNVSFYNTYSGNYIGKALVIRSTTSQGPTAFLNQVTINMGPTFSVDASWTPMIYLPIPLNSSQAPVSDDSLVRITDSPMVGRGIEWDLNGGAWDLKIDGTHRQGPGMMPFVTLGNFNGAPAGLVDIRHTLLDSEVNPLVANLNGASGGINKAYIDLYSDQDASSDVGGKAPIVSGYTPWALNFDQSFGLAPLAAGVEIHDNNGTTNSFFNATNNFNGAENSNAPSGVSGIDFLYGDATAHRWLMNNNNGGAATVAALSEVPQVYNHSGSIQAAPHLIQDSCVLGTSCAVTLTGTSVYTSSTSYTCVGVDDTGIFAVKVAQASGSSVTFTGNATDAIRYTCIGN